MNKERRLGRGLENLLGKAMEAAIESGDIRTAPVGPGVPVQLGVYELDRNPYQPRLEFDDAELTSLGRSLIEHGMLQSIVVRKAGERYQLVAGERRLRAAIKIGWTEVPVKIVEVDDRKLAELAIVENLQRKDLGPLEKATSFARYLHSYHCTQEELAKRLSVDRSTIANLIRLLELPEEVQAAVRTGELTQGHARALLPLGDEQEQIEFCRRICRDQLSVRQTEEMVQQFVADEDSDVLQAPLPAHAARPARSAQVMALEVELKRALGARVDVKQNGRQKGKIVVHFKNHEEFERLYALLLGASHGIKSQAG